MGDETDCLDNLCGDLVSLRRLEPGVLHLLRNKAPGQWCPVEELYRQAPAEREPIKPELVAAWLPDPSADPDYALIVFHDMESGWSLTATYNAARLLQTAGAVR